MLSMTYNTSESKEPVIFLLTLRLKFEKLEFNQMTGLLHSCLMAGPGDTQASVVLPEGTCSASGHGTPPIPLPTFTALPRPLTHLQEHPGNAGEGCAHL